MRPWGGPSREWRDDNIGHFPPNLVLMSWNQHNFLKAWWRDDSRAMSWYHKDFYIHGVIRTPPLEGPQISRQDQMYRWNPTRGNPQNILIKWANSPFLVIFKLSNVVLSIKILMLSILKKSKFISEVYNALNIFKIKKNQSYFSLNFFRSTNSVRLLYRTFHSVPLRRAKISSHFYFNHLQNLNNYWCPRYLILLDRYHVDLKLFRSEIAFLKSAFFSLVWSQVILGPPYRTNFIQI